jgi:hypothetical protein
LEYNEMYFEQFLCQFGALIVSGLFVNH